MSKNSIWIRLKQWTRLERRVLITSSSVAGSILLLRLLGILQPFELAALDQLFRLSPPEPTRQRIVIVEINEQDIRKLKKWPISDAVMAQLLQKINSFKPRAIGLDIYRDLPQEPGHAELVKTAKNIPNLIGIERFQEEKNSGVLPPSFLNSHQVGFNNFIYDVDGKVRRNLLYWYDDNDKAHKSFALSLALVYLKAKGISPQLVNSKYLQLGSAVFEPFKSDDGGYVRAEAAGYQVLGNFRSKVDFHTESVADVLADKVPANLMRDRIVLIGLKASSVGDLFYTPYSNSSLFEAQPKRFFGVELHADFTNQILTAALEGRPLVKFLSDPVEGLWIFSWSWLGASLVWQLRSPKKATLGVFFAGVGLIGSSYLAFLFSYWIPLVPSLVAMVGSAIIITGYLAYLEEELKRSKEFLQKVIDTIADPIFVKDQEHRWIILNQAYCKLIGYSFDKLIYKSDYHFFPKHEADISWQQDKMVFQTGVEHENEEEFTDIRKKTHIIATKRSLHKDAAGNLFLVGVIRDMTERKRIEEELKQTAAELHHQAYHDSLTGLPNRKQFYERLSQCLENARNNNKLVALLFLDLDGFKQVNDKLGHDMGDQLLKLVAHRLTGCLRGSDVVSRLGGDEFTVILPAVPKVEDATRVAEKIIMTLAEPFLLQEHKVLITVSIGISLYPLNGEAADILIKNADAAMYSAKELGRNRAELS
ncbi:MAG TPA: CHASE2 domain-containing protein [Candidatus Obscuribacterales bacterium]